MYSVIIKKELLGVLHDFSTHIYIVTRFLSGVGRSVLEEKLHVIGSLADPEICIRFKESQKNLSRDILTELDGCPIPIKCIYIVIRDQFFWFAGLPTVGADDAHPAHIIWDAEMLYDATVKNADILEKPTML